MTRPPAELVGRSRGPVTGSRGSQPLTHPPGSLRHTLPYLLDQSVAIKQSSEGRQMSRVMASAATFLEPGGRAATRMQPSGERIGVGTQASEGNLRPCLGGR